MTGEFCHALDWFMRILLPTYAALALHRAYAIGWRTSIAALAVMLAAVVAINLYVPRRTIHGYVCADMMSDCTPRSK